MTTRDPAVAGAFYPSDPRTLERMVERLVSAAASAGGQAGAGGRPAVAYVVPHAGYRYSGPVAATGYAQLRQHASEVRRVILVGPAHRVPLEGCAVTGADRWRTPLGDVMVDVAGAQALVAAGLAEVDDGAHAAEHSLEVQVPFLQRVLAPQVRILPVCVGRSDPRRVAALIAAAVAGDGDRDTGTVLLCSTDLSHYLPDEQARIQDRRTADAIEELVPERIGARDACGVFALRGLLHWARTADGGRPLRVVTLALATSADTAGDPSKVVGYPAFAFHAS